MQQQVVGLVAKWNGMHVPRKAANDSTPGPCVWGPSNDRSPKRSQTAIFNGNEFSENKTKTQDV